MQMNANARDARPSSFTSTGAISGIFRLSDCPILVNLAVETRFDYRLLYRLTSLALKFQGILETCNEEIAIFAFPSGGVVKFMEGVGDEIKISKTTVSPRDRGISKVNVRFEGRRL